MAYGIKKPTATLPMLVCWSSAARNGRNVLKTRLGGPILEAHAEVDQGARVIGALWRSDQCRLAA